MFATVVSLVIAAAAAGNMSPAIPNPVSISYGGRIANRTYSVGCWSGQGLHGTWLGVVGSTYTQQEALIYMPAPAAPQSPELETPSILYCFGNDGKPGTIKGAPTTVLLPVGTRVVSYPVAQITMTYRMNGKQFAYGTRVPLVETTVLTSGRDGIVVRTSAHEMAVYPSDATLTIGTARSVGFFRPGTKYVQRAPSQAPAGCAVSIIDSTGTATTRNYVQACADVETLKLWTKG